MPWQPFTPDSGQRKTLREDSSDSFASRGREDREEREDREDRFRRRPSYLEEFDMQVGVSRDNSNFITDFYLFSLRTDHRRMG